MTKAIPRIVVGITLLASVFVQGAIAQLKNDSTVKLTYNWESR